jgi:hypothetical protein
MVAYGFGDAGTGLAATILGFYLFPFFTCAAGLPAFIAGSLLTVIKVWDAFNDPLIGWMSDHTQSRWGPRLPWMLGASMPLGISLAAMWWVPEGTLLQRTIYYVVMAILLMTAYTGVNLPYAALSTELTTDTAYSHALERRPIHRIDLGRNHRASRCFSGAEGRWRWLHPDGPNRRNDCCGDNPAVLLGLSALRETSPTPQRKR